MGGSTPRAPEPDYAGMATDYRQWRSDIERRYQDNLKSIGDSESSTRARLAAAGLRPGTAGYTTAMEASQKKREEAEAEYQEEIEALESGPTYQTLMGKYQSELGATAKERWKQDNPDWGDEYFGTGDAGDADLRLALQDRQGTAPWSEAQRTAQQETGGFEDWVGGLGKAPTSPAPEPDDTAQKRAAAAAAGRRAGGAFDEEDPGMQRT